MSDGEEPRRPWTGPPRPVHPPAAGVAGTPPPVAGAYNVAPRAVEVRLDKRLLWVGSAAYQLHNITRVYTYVMQPDQRGAVERFLRRIGQLLAIIAVIVVVVIAFEITQMGRSRESTSSPPWGLLVIAVGFAVFAVVELIAVMRAPSVPVLAVDTAGAPTAIVTAQEPHSIGDLLLKLTHALENPGTEFRVTMQTVEVTTANYHFGDKVNMYGGTNNTGKAAG